MKELVYQARIKELKEFILELCERYALYTDYNHRITVADEILSSPDDLSALEAYVREEKRKVLDEAMKEFGEDAFLQNGTKAVNVLRGMAKELK